MYDAAMGRFTGLDPISEQFPELSTFNYAENSPIRFIDLHGLQKENPPLFRASGHLGITAGESGFELNIFGSKTGATIMTGSTDFIGGSLSLDSESGFSSGGSLFFSSSEETFGISAGDVFGGEISATIDTETGVSTVKTSVSLGLFSIRNESSIDDEGNSINRQFLNLEFGANAGFIFGIDASVSLDINITPINNQEVIKLDNVNQIQRDNTQVHIPILSQINNN